MQKVVLIGNVGRDPESKSYGSDGKTMTKFNVAVSTSNGKEKTTVWWACTSFGRTGENCLKFLKKGSKVWVSGEPSVHIYRNRLEEPMASLDVTVNEIEFLSGRSDPDQGAHDPTESDGSDQDDPTPTPVQPDELPF